MLAELIDEIVPVRLEWRMKKQVESVVFRVCAALMLRRSWRKFGGEGKGLEE